MKEDNKHLTNEFLYISNSVQDTQDSQDQEDSFEEKARDTSIRLDLYKR